MSFAKSVSDLFVFRYSLSKPSTDTDSIPSDDAMVKLPHPSNYRVVIPPTVLLSTNDRAYQVGDLLLLLFLSV